MNTIISWAVEQGQPTTDQKETLKALVAHVAQTAHFMIAAVEEAAKNKSTHWLNCKHKLSGYCALVYVVQVHKHYDKDMKKLLISINNGGEMAKAWPTILQIIVQAEPKKSRVLHGKAASGYMERAIQAAIEASK